MFRLPQGIPFGINQGTKNAPPLTEAHPMKKISARSNYFAWDSI